MAARTNASLIPKDRLRGLRQRAGMTQEAVASAAGIDIHHYGKIERGVSGWSGDTLEAIARALRVSVAEILASDEIDVEDARTHRLAEQFAALPDDAKDVVERMVNVLGRMAGDGGNRS